MMRLRVGLTVFTLLAFAAPYGFSQIPPPPRVQFQDATTQVLGSVPTCSVGGGQWCAILVGDWNNDGWDDLILDDYDVGLRWYQNNRNGTLTRIPNPLPSPPDGLRTGVWCDLTNHGVEDLIMVGEHLSRTIPSSHVYRNEGNGTFTDVTAAYGLADPGSDERAVTCMDLDHNGFNDLLYARAYVLGVTDARSNLLWINFGGGAFSEQAWERGFTQLTRSKRPYSVAFGELTRNGFPSGVGTGNNYNEWWVAKGDGTVHGTTGVYEPIANLSPYLHDGAFADFNGDGRLDAAIADTFVSGQQPVLWVHCNNNHLNAARGQADGLRTCWHSAIVTGSPGVGEPQSIAVGDFDNDGAPDVFLNTNGGQVIDGTGAKSYDYLFMNDNNRRPTFTEMARAAGIQGPFRSRLGGGGAAVIDYDLDGRLDLVVGYTNLFYPGPWRVYRNVTQTSNRWIGLVLKGRALGAWVDITACGRHQATQITARTGWLHQSSRNAHFGLGACPGPAQVSVTWPDGATTTSTFAANAYYMLTSR